MSSSNTSVLIWTGKGGRFGNGHWVRSTRLKRLLSDLRPTWDCRISLAEPEALLAECLNTMPDLVVVDRRETSSKIFKTLKALGIATLVWDSRGKEKQHADYVVEGFPSLENEPGRANATGTCWLPPPESPGSTGSAVGPSRESRVLIYLGGIESFVTVRTSVQKIFEWLSQQTTARVDLVVANDMADVLLRDPWIHKALNEPDLSRKKILELRVSGIREDFTGLMKACDLYVSYFGLSVFEALSLGRAVLLVNPGRYHQKLSERHLPGIHLGHVDGANFAASKQVLGMDELRSRSKSYQGQFPLGNRFHLLPQILESLILKKSRDRSDGCLACGGADRRVVSRRRQANLVKCRSCGLIWMDEFLPLARFADPGDPAHGSNIYGSEYFVEEYIKTYGKTYEEDRSAIHRYSDARMENILPYKKAGRLLDIGAAMGFFLDRAMANGFETWGVELSTFATGKADPKHRMLNADFLTHEMGVGFDVITLWYVIEHFRDIRKVLEKITSLQGKGAVLALSTPKGDGFTARFEAKKFFAASAEDHYFVYSPSSLAKLLRPHGYRLRRVRTGGIHFERFNKRFPLLSLFFPKSLYPMIARWLGWGDTFEAYFVKIN